MDFFNQNFFRFAFGFIGIITVSVLIIMAAGYFGGKSPEKEQCVAGADCGRP
jgi:hypothetical protein